MNAKPMLCRSPVVRAMLDGRQTQDRRPIKLDVGRDNRFPTGNHTVMNIRDPRAVEYAPYQPGDILWVRETYMRCTQLDGNGDFVPDTTRTLYAATDPAPVGPDGSKPLPWRPSIFMPRWACRLFLHVTAVRVERVQDISIEDCIAEGIGDEETPCPVRRDRIHSDAWYDGEGCEACGALSARELFHSLWHDLYPGSWERNDWVWVYTFERTDRPANWPTAN